MSDLFVAFLCTVAVWVLLCGLIFAGEIKDAIRRWRER